MPYTNITDFSSLSESDRGYIAGIIDGEGCIRIGRGNKKKNGERNLRAFLQIGTTSESLAEFLVKKLGGNYYTYRINGVSKLVHMWMLNAHNAARLLGVVLPHLVIKKQQAKVLLEFSATLRDERDGRKQIPEKDRAMRERLSDKMHKLNQKGPL